MGKNQDPGSDIRDKHPGSATSSADPDPGPWIRKDAKLMTGSGSETGAETNIYKGTI